MKKALTFLLTLCMLLSFAPTAFAASTPPDFSDGWTALTSANTNKPLYDGNYYLSDDITINGRLNFFGNVVLDLNGHVIKLNSSLYGGSATGSVIYLFNQNPNGDQYAINFTLQDSNPTAKHYFSKQPSGLWKWEPTVTEATEGYELVEGGVITGGFADDGGGIYARTAESAVPVVVNINGGNIVGCRAVSNGGGIYNKGSTVNINGGNIKGCCSGNYGGGIRCNGDLTINGGSIKDCVAPNGGGVFFAGFDKTFTMNGGIIENCVGTSVSGGILNYGAVFKMTGGIIKNCKSTDTPSSNAYCSTEVGETYADGGVIDGAANFDNWCDIIRSIDAKGTTVFNGKVTYRGNVYAGIFYGGLDYVDSKFGGNVGNTYTVKFFENDTDTEPFATAFIVGDGTILVPPTAPTKTGYTFDAWYTEGGDEYKFDSAVASDFSLYANFVPHTNHADNDGDGKCDKCGAAVETEEPVNPEEPENPKELKEYIMDIAYEAIIAIILIVIAIIKYYV